MKKAKSFFDMKGMLAFLITYLISKKPMSGQDLAMELEKRRGERPSPGTIYPVLKQLKESQLIRIAKKQSDKKTIYYELTAKGKKELKKAQDIFCQIFAGCNQK